MELTDEQVIEALWTQLDDFDAADIEEGVVLVKPDGCTDEQYKRAIAEVEQRRWTLCGQAGRDARILEAIDNRDIIYYGPHPCEDCGATIVRGSREHGHGHLCFDFPAPVAYPNHNWTLHRCKTPATSETAGG